MLKAKILEMAIRFYAAQPTRYASSLTLKSPN